LALVRTHHNVYDTHYHIVFPVKYRKALLLGDLPLAITEIAQEISQRYDIDFDKIGTDQDHIHLLVSFPPKYGGSDVVRMFKSITARELFKRFLRLEKNSGAVSSGATASTLPQSASGETGKWSSSTSQTRERRWVNRHNFDYSLRAVFRPYPVGLPRGC